MAVVDGRIRQTLKVHQAPDSVPTLDKFVPYISLTHSRLSPALRRQPSHNPLACHLLALRRHSPTYGNDMCVCELRLAPS